MKRVVSCFDLTTNMVRPWAQAGYECVCVDTQHPAGISSNGNVILVGDDMLTSQYVHALEDVAIAFFFPPCTDVAVSGAKWFKDKGLGALIRALQLFKVSVDLGEKWGCPYMIENPVSTVSTYWRKPDHVFHPWHFGDLYTKKTCLWVGNGFRMPTPDHTHEPDGVDDRIHRMPPSPDRANKRSATPMGFAQAVYEANKEYIK